MIQSCCQPDKKEKPAGFFSGLLYGLLPHTFCLAFVVFSVLGATMATTVFKKTLLLPYFFQSLVGISFLLATISAAIYLKKNRCLSLAGIKGKWRYLSILCGTTISLNLLLFLVVFPLAANLSNRQTVVSQGASLVTLKVNIPCPGHAPLVAEELKKTSGIENVVFRLPNSFEISFNQKQISLEQILDLEIFKSFPAREVLNG